jgi:hypothetical protein
VGVTFPVFPLKIGIRIPYLRLNQTQEPIMPEPTSHTAAAVALSATGAGTVGMALGAEFWPLFWAFLGAVCWQAIEPPIMGYKAIFRAAAIAIISTVLGTFGSLIAAAAAIHYFTYLEQVGKPAVIALAAIILGVLGQKLLLRAAEMIGEFRKGSA